MIYDMILEYDVSKQHALIPCSSSFYLYLGPDRFAEKTNRSTVPADLLWEKNTVPAEKTNYKRRIIREANRALNMFSTAKQEYLGLASFT